MGDQNDVVYVAVNEYVRESKLTLLWTLKKFRVKKLYLLHVHVPFSLTSSTCGYKYNESEINAIHQSNINTLDNNLHEYRDICTSKGVNKQNVDVAHITGSDIGQGIVELIYQKNIKKLIMGAAADPHYSKGMSDITSIKAEYVRCYAPSSCKIWFVCKGKLIKTSEGRYGLYNPLDPPSDVSGSNDHQPKPETGKPKGKEDKADSEEPPEKYICPISLRIMKDPHLAADGHSYDPKSFKGWLSSGGQISPMTRIKLPNHTLIPNHALRSLIIEWLEAHPDYRD